MAKTELTAEQKNEARKKELDRRNGAVLRAIVSAAKRQPDARLDTFDALTHAIPKKMLLDAIEAKTIKADYLEWIEENAPHVIKKTGSGGGGSREPKEPRVYPSWIDKVDDAPKKLIDAGTKFNANLATFVEENQEALTYFADEYNEVWKEYFRLVKPSDGDDE